MKNEREQSHMRTARDEWYLDIAERCAKQGSCLRRNYGAVIVDSEGAILSTGYTGMPCGIPHCETLGFCWREQHSIPSGQMYDKCRSVHAEINAVVQAGRLARGATMYIVGVDAKTGKNVATMPCFSCSKAIINAKLQRVIVRDKEGETQEWTPSEIYAIREFEALGGLT